MKIHRPAPSEHGWNGTGVSTFFLVLICPTFTLSTKLLILKITLIISNESTLCSLCSTDWFTSHSEFLPRGVPLLTSVKPKWMFGLGYSRITYTKTMAINKYKIWKTMVKCRVFWLAGKGSPNKLLLVAACLPVLITSEKCWISLQSENSRTFLQVDSTWLFRAHFLFRVWICWWASGFLKLGGRMSFYSLEGSFPSHAVP